MLVLFTDGLVDRRDVSVEEGLDRLRTVATELADRDRDIEEVCGSLLLSLVPEDASDDVAVLAARLDPVGTGCRSASRRTPRSSPRSGAT